MELKFKEADDGYRATFITGGRCGLLLNREREGVVYFNYSDGDGEPVPIPYADRRKDIYIPFNLPSGVWVTVVSKMPVLYAAMSGDAEVVPDVDPTQRCYPNAVQDYDGNWYDAVILGDQVWMAESLRTKHSPSGDVLSFDYPNNDSSNKNVYGLLYDWETMMNGEQASSLNPSGVVGIGPNGWHIPSRDEWSQLMDYVGSDSRFYLNNNNTYIAKALASKTGWKYSGVDYTPGKNYSDNNATGFNAMPSGLTQGNFGYFSTYWSATLPVPGQIYRTSFWIRYQDATVSADMQSEKVATYSVRCICDKTPDAFAKWYVKTYKTTNHQVENKYAE